MTTPTNNDRRAMRIGHILTWCKDWGSEREGLIDLLIDARHWCDRTGEGFADLDRIAHQHYLNERHSIEGNAPCEGISAEDLERGLVRELRESLIAASDWIDARLGEPRTEIQAKVRQAIAKAAGDLPAAPRKPIVIEVLGGVVQDVLNLPPGCEYEVKDYDDLNAALDGATAT